MKIMTVLGTRPEIIRLSRVIPRLDELCEHTLVHTGQNFDPNLHDVFFDQLGLRRPDHQFDARAETFTGQINRILSDFENLVREQRPDRLLILGDTNSALTAFIARRLGIPVFHMEAGNRCFDERVPEEINRRVIDQCSSILMPYTERSRANLLREGFAGNRIYVTGNPIHEILKFYSAQIDASDVLARLKLKSGEFFLVTLHRAENVDIPERLQSFVRVLDDLHGHYGIPVVCSIHPRTRSRMEKSGITFSSDGIMAMEPMGLFDFVHLEKHAGCVLTDSGTVQEECAIFQIPNVTLRDCTERPETLECGSNLISGADKESIFRCVNAALSHPPAWIPPVEYLSPSPSETAVRITIGHHEDLR